MSTPMEDARAFVLAHPHLMLGAALDTVAELLVKFGDAAPAHYIAPPVHFDGRTPLVSPVAAQEADNIARAADFIERMTSRPGADPEMPGVDALAWAFRAYQEWLHVLNPYELAVLLRAYAHACAPDVRAEVWDEAIELAEAAPDIAEKMRACALADLPPQPAILLAGASTYATTVGSGRAETAQEKPCLSD